MIVVCILNALKYQTCTTSGWKNRENPEMNYLKASRLKSSMKPFFVGSLVCNQRLNKKWKV